jgi:DNA repair protein RadC
MPSQVQEARAEYRADDAVLAAAMKILAKRLKQPGQMLSSPTIVKDYLTLHLATLEAERFDALFADVKNRLLKHEIMFTGTITHTSVYPREVVKLALQLNASSVILAHNHPSGDPAPSEADHRLTRALTQALGLVDIRVLDHVIVAGMRTHSMAEHGQI